MLRFHFLVLLLLGVSSAFAAESLRQSDFVGDWSQSHPISEGEIAKLSITQDMAVRFKRSFDGDSPDQEFDTGSGGLKFVDDIALVELRWDDGSLAYKLVLSGWRAKNNRAIFGTMYMYRDGNVFNGLPISFRIED